MPFHPFSAATLLASAALTAATSISVTPHDQYSSSIGVLGCKIDTNRVAYFPQSPDCNDICVQVSYGGRSLNLLRIDQSGGAYDMSYDAWNYLFTGNSATTNPVAGGGVVMEYSPQNPSACAGLIYTTDSKLPLSAANSMNFLASCLSQPGSWVANNYMLFNIANPTCTIGYDEVCTLDWPAQNQATCPHQLGAPVALSTAPVFNILYPTGQEVVAP